MIFDHVNLVYDSILSLELSLWEVLFSLLEKPMIVSKLI